jgi:GDPmannose 4,6-dehydratase
VKCAVVTGITGQDGSYLAEFLLARGYTVHGLIRRASTFNTGRIDHLFRDPHDPDARLHLHHGDLTDGGGLRALLELAQPDEVYNLGAQSHVRVSFDQAEYTADVDAVGTLRLLEAIRDHVRTSGRDVRFYQAGSSEMFGASPPPQSETTPFHPRSPYAVAKVFAHFQTINHREAYGLFACNGILFNHESPRRGETFFTRKITRAATRISLGLQDTVHVGNLGAKRDWGHARDYVRAMWLMLQQDEPGDYVIATGEMISAGEFARRAFARLALDADRHIRFDPRYLRAAEVDALRGDATRARERLGWRPETSLEEMIDEMVASDLVLARQERLLHDHRAEIDATPEWARRQAS